MYIISFQACQGTRHLQEGQYLYTGAEIVYEGPGEYLPGSKEKEKVQEAIQPSPNSRILGMRPKVVIYNMIKKEPLKEKGFRRWIKYKIGEAPVLFSEVNTEFIPRLIANKLHNLGYFHSTARAKVIRSKRKAKLIYTAEVKRPWTIDNLVYFPEKSGV
jgi:hypothetical protein